MSRSPAPPVFKQSVVREGIIHALILNRLRVVLHGEHVSLDSKFNDSLVHLLPTISYRDFIRSPSADENSLVNLIFRHLLRYRLVWTIVKRLIVGRMTKILPQLASRRE
jgi:hypothetical protein